MKKARVLRLAGLMLVLCSLMILAFGLIHNHITQKKNQQLATRIQALLPPRLPGTQETLTDMAMPVLPLDGADYIALLEVPSFGVALPIRSHWDTWSSQSCPSRFSGTVYNGTLVIGGSGKAGHLDFLGRIELGDTVKVTAMDGTVFSYRVTQIRRAQHASQELLMDESAQLTLFARNPNSLEYIIVRCNSI